MTTAKSQVIESKILGIRKLPGPSGRVYQEIRIEYPDMTFLPGQFVMVKKALGPTHWAYPYMIQESGENEITVYAVPGASLYDTESGIPLLVWGANGRGIAADQNTVVISQAGTAFFATPFLNQVKGIRHILIGGHKEDVFLSKYANTSAADSTEEAAALAASAIKLRSSENVKLLFALNVSESRRLLELVREAGDSRLTADGSIQILAPTRINCGVGGCKGCYLHSKELKLGIAVCCSGPFLPGEKIDFEADQRCFHVFE